MAFRLRDDEAVDAGVRRVVAEQVERAARSLRDVDPTGRDEAIHDVRKRCKRVRAAVRLVRDDLGTKTYRRENRCLRDAARALAPSRDAHVLVVTLDRVVDHFADQLDPDAFAGVRKVLAERRDAIVGGADAVPDAVELAHGELLDAVERVAGWPLDHDGWETLAPGLELTYRRGRVRMHEALTTTDAVVFHEWRKRAKYLWHQVQLLTPAWPPALDVLADEIHALSDDLGDAHDLAMLGAALEREPDLSGDPVAVDALVGLISRRRRHFQDAARARGRLLYAEPPARFVARMGTYWHAWRGR